MSKVLIQPQRAFRGAGAIIDKPAAIKGDIANRPMIKVTLSYYHRAIDGAKTAEFMKTLKALTQDPVSSLAG